MKGINDSKEDAERLAVLLRPIRAKINLIPFNSYDGAIYECSEESEIHNFREILNKNNYTAVVRYSKGQDISAACGQLGANMMLNDS